ncbi:MAG: hypothetical protein RLZZ46_863 [Bacteroidota bacterium]
MKSLTPSNIAILASIILGSVLGLGNILSDIISNGEVFWSEVLLTVVLTVSVSYLVFFVTMKFFIYEKIKELYDFMDEAKSGGANFSIDRVSLDEDFLRAARQDMMTWAIERRKEIEQLKKMETYRKEFVGNVSHELKTPIFNIQGYIYTLLDGGMEDPSINRDYLERASRSVERMITIVEDLDVISQMESGELLPYLEKTDLVTLVLDVFKAQDIKARDKKVELKFDKAYDKVYVMADKGLIRQVFTNLIVNSIKYGKVNGTTVVSFSELKDVVRIEVEDNGMGISRAHLPRIFERFYRVDKGRSREHGGTGLGLAIVKHIVEAHHQTIDVRSIEGESTCFSFTLQKG